MECSLKRKYEARGVARLAECLLSWHDTPSSTLGTAEKNKETNKQTLAVLPYLNSGGSEIKSHL